jgi:hypothetical protein
MQPPAGSDKGPPNFATKLILQYAQMYYAIRRYVIHQIQVHHMPFEYAHMLRNICNARIFHENVHCRIPTVCMHSAHNVPANLASLLCIAFSSFFSIVSRLGEKIGHVVAEVSK